MPLLLMEEAFFSSLSKISTSKWFIKHQDFTEWVASEFRSLLAASLEASALAIRRQSIQTRPNELSSGFFSLYESSQIAATQLGASSSGKSTQELQSMLSSRDVALCQKTPVGLLLIRAKASEVQNSSNFITSFTFAPAYEICRKGISVKLLQTFENIRCGRIIRNPILFNVIPKDHPVFRALRQHDVVKVQSLLSSKEVSPNDRCPDGSSLLTVSSATISASFAHL